MWTARTATYVADTICRLKSQPVKGIQRHQMPYEPDTRVTKGSIRSRTEQKQHTHHHAHDCDIDCSPDSPPSRTAVQAGGGWHTRHSWDPHPPHAGAMHCTMVSEYVPPCAINSIGLCREGVWHIQHEVVHAAASLSSLSPCLPAVPTSRRLCGLHNRSLRRFKHAIQAAAPHEPVATQGLNVK
jgi:hypothetical protein